MITRTERGWGAHYCCASQCRFRRNTLVSSGDKHIVVSTVGNYRETDKDGRERGRRIGSDRYFETMVFRGNKDGKYIDADISIELRVPLKWKIDKLYDGVDNEANDMHEAHVDYCVANFDDVFGHSKERVGDDNYGYEEYP